MSSSNGAVHMRRENYRSMKMVLGEGDRTPQVRGLASEFAIPERDATEFNRNMTWGSSHYLRGGHAADYDALVRSRVRPGANCSAGRA